MAVESSASNDRDSSSDCADKLRVLTLNCWGIPFVSKLKKERFDAIGDELQKGSYDIVSLQEVWDTNDFENLRKLLRTVLPYSFYFYGGVAGTGICVFSRYPILDTFTYPFLLNGYAYALAHGDWYGGKQMCFALIDHPVVKIHFFTSHLHAEYDRVHDDYIGHRATQAYHAANVINKLTKPEDFVILCGDMNSEPPDLACRLIKTLPGLTDSWEEQDAQVVCESLTSRKALGCHLDPGNTCDRRENIFTKTPCSVTEMGGPNDGKRIDYIFYRSSNHQCENVVVTMGKVPGKGFPYSDHDGVAATFALNKKRTVKVEVDAGKRQDDILSVLSETNTMLRKQSRLIWNNLYKKLLFSLFLLMFILLPVIYPGDVDSLFAMQHIFGRFFHIVRVALTIFLSGYLWILFMKISERRNYQSTIHEIDLHLSRMRSTR